MLVLLPATPPSELYKMISNSFQNYTCLLNMPTYCFDFNVYKQANVNMVIRSWQHYRRFLGAISFLYHHDYVYPCVDPGNFVGYGSGAGGRGVQARLTEKSFDVVVFFFVLVSLQLILQSESSDHGFFKENYH